MDLTTVPEIVCPQCDTPKPLTEDFWYMKDRRGGYYLKSACRECEKARRRRYTYDTRIEHTCEDCGLVRLVSQSRDYKRPATKWCKSCAGKRHSKRSRHFTGTEIAQWRQNAEKRGKAWLLSNDQLDALWERQGGVCALSGRTMSSVTHDPDKYSLDRIDSDGDYEVGNCQYLCWIVNQAKNDLTTYGFIEMCRDVAAKNAEISGLTKSQNLGSMEGCPDESTPTWRGPDCSPSGIIFSPSGSGESILSGTSTAG